MIRNQGGGWAYNLDHLSSLICVLALTFSTRIHCAQRVFHLRPRALSTKLRVICIFKSYHFLYTAGIYVPCVRSLSGYSYIYQCVLVVLNTRYDIGISRHCRYLQLEI
jgi:hypothetical protein